MLDDPTLDTFLDNLITQKYGFDISSHVRDQLKSELSPRLEKWLILRAMEEIGHHSEVDLKTFQDMVLADESNEKIMGFIHEKIPDTAAFFASSLVAFQNTIMHPEEKIF